MRWWVRGQIVMSLLLQVPTVPGGRGVGEQPSGPIKLTWIQGQPAPEGMGSPWGSAVVHGSTAYSLRATMCIHTQYLKTSGPNYHSANMNTLPWQ